MFVQYSTYILSMDLCGTDMLNENILLQESQKEYFDKKQQVSVSQSFACRWIEGQRMKDE